MNESAEKFPTSKKSAETKEGEPQIRTVYAYITKSNMRGSRVDRILGLYTDKNDALKSAQLDDMYAEADEVIVPLHVYERLEDLPEAIRERVKDTNESVPTTVLEKKDGVVYAVLPNTDSTEGNGHDFIWALTADPALADKIAWGNGPSGSNANVVDFPLDTFPIEEGVVKDANLRRNSKGELSDELYSS